MPTELFWDEEPLHKGLDVLKVDLGRPMLVEGLLSALIELLSQVLPEFPEKRLEERAEFDHYFFLRLCSG